MAIENINDYAGMWANGVNIGQLWDKIKEKFVAGYPGESGGDPAIDQSSYSAAWKQQARANIGLTIGLNQIWYGSAANTIGTITTSTLGRKLLGSSIAANKIWYASAADEFTATDISSLGISLLNASLYSDGTNDKDTIWYGKSSNGTLDKTPMSVLGKSLLNATTGTMISGLAAESAKKDEDGDDIKATYAYSMAVYTDSGSKYLGLYNKNAGVLPNASVILNKQDGLVQLSGGKIPLTVFPDAILGQLTFGGTITEYTSTTKLYITMTAGAKRIMEQRKGWSSGFLNNAGIYLENLATPDAPSGNNYFFNFADCKGMYFVWTASAMNGASYKYWKGKSTDTGNGIRFQTGDWLTSLEDRWDKVDNTDAVTTVSGINDDNVDTTIYGTPTITDDVVMNAARVRALDTGLPNNTQTVAGKVQFNKDIWSLGGMAAYGISDLSAGGGGGGGLSGTIIRNWSNYQGVETEVLGANLGMRGFRMSGAAFQVNKPAAGGADNWQTEFTFSDSNIPDLPLTKITGTTELRKIESLAGTGTPSGYLTRATNGNWSFATIYAPTAGGTAGYVLIGNGTTSAPVWNNTLFVDSTNSRVGIGTNSPSSSLDIYAQSGEVLRLAMAGNYTAGAGPQITFNNATAEKLASIGGVFDRTNNGNYGNLVFGTRTSDTAGVETKMTILYNGNVGIGVTAPDTKLHVSGNIKGTQLISTQAQGTAPLVVTSTTKVANLNADLLDGYEASGLFESLTNDSDQLKVKIGNTTKTLTLDYAKKTSRMRTEIKADQEFVYRQSPQTIDADSLVINKFKGRTLAWNQLCPTMTSQTQTSYQVTLTVDSSGIARLNGTASGGMAQFTIGSCGRISGHKYFLRTIGVQGTSSNGIYVNWDFPQAVYITTSSLIYTAPSTNDTAPFKLRVTSGYACNNVLFHLEIFDLTLMFGSGNEPTAAQFEALFPNAYYAYNAGELRNNDAKQFESVGFNLWDGKIAYDNSVIKAANGDLVTGSSYTAWGVCDYIPIFPNQTYYFNYAFCPGSSVYGVCYYDRSKNFIGGSVISETEAFTRTTPVNAYYMRLSVRKEVLSTACINISNPTKNGTYEPYRRIVTDLNLDAIQVKSHNIWDEEWEIGYIDNSTGLPYASNSYIRSKNYIPIKPSTTYYWKGSHSYKRIYFYDENKTFISYTNGASNSTFDTPSNCRYFKISEDGSTYNNDICINESSSFNGQYEPHGILTINGLKQAGDVYDEIVGNKLVKRIIEKRLLDLTWTKSGLGYGYYSDYISETKGTADGDTMPNLIASRFEVVTKNVLVASSARSLKISQDTTKSILVCSSAANSDAFVQTLSDSDRIYVELAIPIEYDLVAPIPTAMPAGTTERRLPEDTSASVLAPFACDMTYGTNPGDILASAVPFSRLQGVRLERGAFTMSTQNDSNWYLVTLGDKKLYLRFTVNTGAFKLEMASDDTANPEYSKEFEFATLSSSEINAICV